jgi:hypothetical protein
VTTVGWTWDDVEAAVAELFARYDDWNLAAVGSSVTEEGVCHGTAWIAQGTTPQPMQLAWLAGLDPPAMIKIEEYGEPADGEGRDVETPHC